MSKEYEVQVDKMIKDAGLTAPRITPEHIDSLIVDKTFTVLPSGKVMVCEITLKNGFTVRGEASAVSKENFNEEIGRKVSFDKARAQIWPLEGYRLQENLHSLADFRKFVDLIETRAAAADGPVTPFLDELMAASDVEKERFTGILRNLYRG
jgi:hypothetical protein